MKNKIIRIDDISDIDTSRISVYDLNNRYIDRRGNMYTLRYNKVQKKVEIIKIMRTHINDASYFQRKVIQNKIDRSRNENIEPEEKEAHDDYDDNEDTFEPNSFINLAIELMMTHRERLKGIMMNIKNSNVVQWENKAASTELDEIFRNIDIDGIQSFEKAENYQKELINYPRSITYYQAKIDKKGRDIIEALAGHNERIMKFIYVYEMLQTIKALYRNLKKLINTLKTYIDGIEPEDIKNLNQGEKQFFNDALVSINNTIDEIDDLLDGSRHLEEYVYSNKNF
ncbi:MAG TPA: hypothetical protein PK926_14305 [Spirochaetota bacterium]|nr:hypothetical protein [Spirochaetota bacterium]HPI90678.1 hypothetical protein [Spirochaetota bacterium]HPR49169.1 hypothetical protein [Spirochaetota bacterium]